MTSILRSALTPGCVTGVGSLPFLDADEAVGFVAEHCPELPFWPQLPRREAGEGVIGQGLGTLIEFLEPSDRPYCWSVKRGAADAFAAALDGADAGLNPETAAGFFALERAIGEGRFPTARALKAQLEGPVTVAHCLFLDGTPAARIPGWLDRLAAYLARQAAWQVGRLRARGLPVLLMLDEPALAFVDDTGPARAAVASALDRIVDAARRSGAVVGLHCCSALPASLLTDLWLDVVSFDAHLAVADDAFIRLGRALMGRGGHLAFGLAPTRSSTATVESLGARWLSLAGSLGDPRAVAAQTLVTATCGLGLASASEATASFALARGLASSIASQAAARGPALLASR